MPTTSHRVQYSKISSKRFLGAMVRALAAALFLLGACLGVAQGQVITEFSANITAGAQPLAITAGPDGNVWFTEYVGNRIGRITPAGAITEFSANITANAGPAGITAGPDGNLWFAEFNIGRIGRITPLGVVTEFSANITTDAGPFGITAGPDGNLWFTEYNISRIGRITPAGVVTEFSDGITPGAGPSSIAAGPDGIIAGPDGNLWFTELDGNRIGRITPLGVVTEFSANITAGASPRQITAGPDGNLWFTEFTGNRIGRITPAGVVTEFSAGITGGAAPDGITAGPDGALWFTEQYIDRIGRITVLGVVTEIGTNITAGASPRSITAGPDGNLWFTEVNGDRIGKVALQSTVTVTKAGSGSGNVKGNDGMISCGATCTHTYPDGTVLTLTATANAGSVFTGWLGACTGTGPCELTISSATAVSATFAPSTIGTHILDIDDNGSYDALTDGLMVIRYLFGLTGTSVTTAAVASGAPRFDPTQIATYQTNVRPLLDVDGNGEADPFTDGVLIIRYLFGLRGNALVSGAVGSGATRTSGVAITTYLQGLTP